VNINQVNEHVDFANTSYAKDPAIRFVILNKLKAIPEIAMIGLGGKPPSLRDGGTPYHDLQVRKNEIETEAYEKSADINYGQLINCNCWLEQTCPFLKLYIVFLSMKPMPYSRI
jgi:hypothetical protein